MNVQRHTDHGTRSVSGRPHHLAVPMGLRTLLAVLTLVISFGTLAAPAGAHEYVPEPPLAADAPHSHTVPVCPAGYTASVEPGTGDLACLGPYLNGYTNLCLNGVLIDESTCQYQTGTTTTQDDVWVVDQAAYSYDEDQGYYITDIQTQCTTTTQYGVTCDSNWILDQLPDGSMYCFEPFCYSNWGNHPACTMGPAGDLDTTTCTDVPVQTWVPNIVTIYVDEVGHWETQTVTVPVYATEPSYLGCLAGWNDNGDGCTNPLGTNVPPSSWACATGWITEGPIAPELITETTLCWQMTDNEVYNELLEDAYLLSYQAQRELEERDLTPTGADELWELSWDQFDDRWRICWDDQREEVPPDDRSIFRRGASWLLNNTNPFTAVSNIVPDALGSFFTDGLMCVAVVVLVPDQNSMSVVLSGALNVDSAFVSFSECTHEPSENDSCVTRGFLSAPAQALNAAAAGQLDCKGPNIPVATMINTVENGLPDDNPLASEDLSSSLDDEDFYPASGCEGTHIATLGGYVRDPLSWLIAAWCIWTLMKMGRRMVVGG